jgi:F-type H+-transporting ATPase subunit gamma
MAVSTRLIRRRIKSITNTRKITKAMELVAASKMKRAVQMAVNSRAYAGTTKELVDEIQKYVTYSLHHMLFGPVRTKTTDAPLRTLVIVCSSDRGLCGGFNAQCLKRTIEFFKEREKDSLSVMTVGKRANRVVNRLGLPIVASFEAISNAPSFARAKPVGLFASQSFSSKTVDRVFIVYMDFKSAIKQIPTVEQILPIIPENELEERTEKESEILFEPDANRVLELLLPKFVEIRIYQALLESSASEHSARMMAMRSATDNATTMVDSLTLSYNQARQASITQEISEISAGKAAIE